MLTIPSPIWGLAGSSRKMAIGPSEDQNPETPTALS